MEEGKKIVKKSSVLDQWRKRKNKISSPSKIPSAPEGELVQPTSGQQRLWLLQKLYPENAFYQYGHLYKMTGALDAGALEKSFQQVIARHEILRTNFLEKTQSVELVLHPTLDFSLEKIDFSSLPENEKTSAAEQATQQAASQTFDLAKDPLLRVSLWKISDAEHWMILSIHHIIGDRSSLLVLQKDLFDFYEKNLSETSTTSNFEPEKTGDSETSKLQYSDYAFWKNNQVTETAHLDYWLHQLGGDLPLLNLPTDFSRPKSITFRGETISKKLSLDCSTKVENLAKKHSTTRYVILLAAFKVWLFRYSGQQDILVGSPFSNRDKVELENMIGFFNETLVLRTKIEEEVSFDKFVEQVKATTMDALVHKNVPFDELVRQLNPERHGSANPIFQTMFVYNNTTTETERVGDLEISEASIDLGVSKFDLTFFATDHGEQLEISLEYALDLFEKTTAEQFLQHLENIIESAVQNPQQYISKLEILSAAEKNTQLVEWNNTQAAVPDVTAIHTLIEKMATDFPDRTAVVYQEDSLTYAELNKRGNTIANVLLRNGIKASSPVGLYTNRSVEMMIGILGILKAGAAYLPLDPEYPQERIDFILQDAGVEFILSQKNIANSLDSNSAKVIILEELIEANSLSKNKPTVEMPQVQLEDLAYVIYTSGSTGRPKGVPISHKNLIHSTAARFHFFTAQPSAFLLLSSFAFDSSVAGIFWTLCSGGTLVLPPRRIEQDIQQLAQTIQKNKISHTLLLPTLYGLLLENAALENLTSLKTVMVAGEACASNIVLQHYKKMPTVALVNEYGPTEGTVWCTAHHIRKEDAFGLVPIGRPIPNVENFILDKNLQAVPVGVVGELYVGGQGVANRYWERPELTTERFLPHPFDKNDAAKIYKTGDLVRYRKDGLIDFLGRADQQVKIRGHRIEPDEIRAVLLKMENVKEALVVVQKNHHHNRLLAYLIFQSPQSISEIREELKTVFPDYMVPAALVELEEFPKLPNGKIDMKNLPDPTKEDLAGETKFVAAETEVEKQLVSIWEKVLGVSPIGLHDNFFEIGGDSIQSIQVMARAQKAGIKLATNQLFEHQTIGELAHFLEKEKNKPLTDGEENSNWSSVVSLNKKGSGTPLFCIHSGGGHVFFYQPLAQHLGKDKSLYALQPKGLDGKETLHNSIEEMADFYIQEMKKVQPAGPYQILGTCFSNAVGLEMANQLQANGEEVNRLIFVDSGPAYLLGAAERGGKQTTRRFVKMLQDGNWNGIQKKLRNRFIRTKQKALAPLENEQEKNLRLTISNLNELYQQYTWKAFAGEIIFIRSTEFAQRKEKDIHLEQWGKLAKGGLEVHVVEGHHKTLFEEPEVKGLAEKIKAVLAALPTPREGSEKS